MYIGVPSYRHGDNQPAVAAIDLHVLMQQVTQSGVHGPTRHSTAAQVIWRADGGDIRLVGASGAFILYLLWYYWGWRCPWYAGQAYCAHQSGSSGGILADHGSCIIGSVQVPKR